MSIFLYLCVLKEEARRQASSSAEQRVRDELRTKSERVIELEKDREASVVSS